ncbi:MAG: AmmeMemoRadiSam system radical SAM enzyme [Candidatus Omnitrophica bacterium CG1_02_49_10]|nr:MAG: AmmeMemoRadiSam system radical SAM enzyme [Candidatus Omnitrophica bacterium CG1_02_49_10]
MKEALYYKKIEDGKVECLLCPQECKIADGKAGFCRVRKNESGTLYALTYNRTTSVALDPIEKKPLYHFHPGEHILSLGTKGCNLACLFCQNWAISQDDNTRPRAITAADAVEEAKERGSFGIAYTYNEPFVWYEFILESSKLARTGGLKNVLVTNGYVNKEPLEEILPYIDAMNIDLKSIEDGFYGKICKGRLAPVLETIKITAARCHVEITNLVIPGFNDSDENFKKLADWIAENTGEDTPLHFSRYFPCYKMDSPPTPIETLERAAKIAKRRLKLVYLGNV